MSVPLAIAIYLILWWLTFFTVLPIGAQSTHEAGEAVVPGTEPGAPRVHNLGKPPRMLVLLHFYRLT